MFLRSPVRCGMWKEEKGGVTNLYRALFYRQDGDIMYTKSFHVSLEEKE